MQRVCFLLKVRADRLDEYRERHAAVWPEMLQALSATGWHNYSLFLREDGLLVGYVETEDFAAARAAWRPPASTPAGRRRWRRSSNRWTAPDPTRRCNPSPKSSISPDQEPRT